MESSPNGPVSTQTEGTPPPEDPLPVLQPERVACALECKSCPINILANDGYERSVNGVRRGIERSFKTALVPSMDDPFFVRKQLTALPPQDVNTRALFCHRISDATRERIPKLVEGAIVMLSSAYTQLQYTNS